MGKVDLLFTAWNRLGFTHASWMSLVAHTDWRLVEHLWVWDDRSTDGTAEFLDAVVAPECLPKGLPMTFFQPPEHVGSPVAAMNWVIEQGEAEYIAKIDNDIVVPRGWLNRLHGVLRSSDELALLGAEPRHGRGTLGDKGYRPAPHIGGVGLMRRAAFTGPMAFEGRLGFTHWQESNDIPAGFVAPDLKLFWLDRMPMEPFASLSEQYKAEGWQRDWGVYPTEEPGRLADGVEEDMSWYWDWWLRDYPLDKWKWGAR